MGQRGADKLPAQVAPWIANSNCVTAQAAVEAKKLNRKQLGIPKRSKHNLLILKNVYKRLTAGVLEAKVLSHSLQASSKRPYGCAYVWRSEKRQNANAVKSTIDLHK